MGENRLPVFQHAFRLLPHVCFEKGIGIGVQRDLPVKRNPFARTACEYGPIGFGALSVTMMSFMAESSWIERKNSTRYQHSGIERAEVNKLNASQILVLSAKTGV